MDEIKPKPCPFCGSTDVESCPGGERSGGRAWLAYYVACNVCGCTGPIIKTRGRAGDAKAARDASINLWNWRANDHR